MEGYVRLYDVNLIGTRIMYYTKKKTIAILLSSILLSSTVHANSSWLYDNVEDENSNSLNGPTYHRELKESARYPATSPLSGSNRISPPKYFEPVKQYPKSHAPKTGKGTFFDANR